ncbi:MAG TPA: DUF5335 family protein [Phycisphaerales bacterium]|nr:DUF5335 family protein [Phycisphaerales bacterium]
MTNTLTHDIPRAIWGPYFDGLSRMYQGWRVTVEVLSSDMGDQPVAEGARLYAITLEPRGDEPPAVLIQTGDDLEGVHDHYADAPIAVREVNTQPGYEADVQIESLGGVTTLLRIQRRAELPPARTPSRLPTARAASLPVAGAVLGLAFAGLAVWLVMQLLRPTERRAM